MRIRTQVQVAAIAFGKGEIPRSAFEGTLDNALAGNGKSEMTPGGIMSALTAPSPKRWSQSQRKAIGNAKAVKVAKAYLF